MSLSGIPFSDVFAFYQLGKELAKFLHLLESTGRKVERLLEADFKAGISALDSALKCAPSNKHRISQLTEARSLFRMAIYKESKKLKRACAHVFFAFCQYQLALSDAIRSRKASIKTRPYKPSIKKIPARLVYRGNLDRGLERDAMDHLCAAAGIAFKSDKGVSETGMSDHVSGEVGKRVMKAGGTGAAAATIGGVAALAAAAPLAPVIGAAAGAGLIIGFAFKGDLRRLQNSLREYLKSRFKLKKMGRLYTPYELKQIRKKLGVRMS